jgi:hypothetical protein
VERYNDYLDKILNEDILSENKTTKTELRHILKLVENYLYSLKRDNIKIQQNNFEKIEEIANRLNIDPFKIIDDAKVYFKKHNLAMSMNGII